MDNENQIITITGVDKDAIEMGAAKQGCWVIPFKISPAPDQGWERKFYEIQAKQKTELRRKSTVAGDVIRVEIAETDDLQKILDNLKCEVADTNAVCDVDYQKKMKIRQDFEELLSKQTMVTQKIKGAADQLKY